MRVGVLGRPALCEADTMVPLAGLREGALLAVLVANLGSTIRAEQLEDEVWEGRRVSEAALRVAINRLRRRGAVGGSNLVVSEPGGYRLALKPDDVDAAHWSGQLDAARQARSRGRPGEALAALDGAERLWRGEPYDGFDQLASVRPHRDRLLEQRWASQEQRAAMLFEVGDLVGAHDVLNALLASQPLREPAWALAMAVLAQQGRRAEALNAYGAMCAHLATELGGVPGPEPRSVHQALVDGGRIDPADVALLVPSACPSPTFWSPTGPSPAGAAVAPAAARRESDPPMVGRSTEMAALQQALDGVGAGPPAAVTVLGEAGIGKSTLVERFVADRLRLGGGALMGRCSRTGAVPLHSVLDALDPYLGPAGGTSGLELARVLSRDHPGSVRRAEGAELLHRRVLSLLGDLVARAAHPHGLVLCLDDAQWADPLSLAFVEHLLSRRDRLPVLLVLTVRSPSDTLVALEGLLDGAAAPGRATQVAVGPLGQDHLDELLGAGLGDDERSRILRASGGNPLFALQLRDLLDAPGAAPTALPETLQRLCSARLAGVPANVRTALRAAAVLGDDVDAGALAALLGWSHADVLPVLTEARAAGLLRERSGMDRYAFVHGVMRQTALGQLDGSARAHLHAAAARWLETNPVGNRGDIADHLMAARPLGSDADRARALLLAGSEALAVGDHLRAMARFNQVGELANPAPERQAEAVLGLGLGAAAGGDASASDALLRDALEAAHRLGSWDLVADALIARSRFGNPASIPEASAEAAAAEQALEHLDHADHLRRGLLLCWRAELLVNIDAAEAAASIDDASRVSEACDNPELSGLVALVRLRQAEAQCAPPEECVRAAVQLLKLAGGRRDPLLAQRARLLLHGARLRAGRFRDVEHPQEWSEQPVGRPGDDRADGRGGTRTRVDSADAGTELHRRLALVGLATAVSPIDAIDEASRAATDEVPSHLALAAATSRVLHLAVIRREQRRLSEIEPALQLSLDTSPRRIARPLLAAARLDAGDSTAASNHLECLLDELDGLQVDWAYLATLAFGAEVAASAGHRPLARRLDHLLARHGPQNVVACSYLLCLGHIDRYRGLIAQALGDHDRAIDAFGAAREANDAEGARLWAAWAAAGEAESRLRRAGNDDLAAAALLLVDAAAPACEYGSGRLARRVAQLDAPAAGRL
ncbi:MAG: BTAD domain-containing putative transcriptional regulator [Microthrixaceae bacterium]